MHDCGFLSFPFKHFVLLPRMHTFCILNYCPPLQICFQDFWTSFNLCILPADEREQEQVPMASVVEAIMHVIAGCFLFFRCADSEIMFRFSLKPFFIVLWEKKREKGREDATRTMYEYVSNKKKDDFGVTWKPNMDVRKEVSAVSQAYSSCLSREHL